MSYQIHVKAEPIDALLFRDSVEATKETIAEEKSKGNEIASVHTGSGKEVTQQFTGSK